MSDTDKELKLCNCDGEWHVEIDGTTHYVDVSNLTGSVDIGSADVNKTPKITDSPETYSTGSLQADLEQILHKFEQVARTWSEEDGRPKHLFLDLEQEAAEALKAILATVSKHLPEKISEYDSETSYSYMTGYNTAITEMEKRLGGR